jgi:hypothetical protein
MNNATKRQRLTPTTPDSSATKARQNRHRPLAPEEKKMQLELLETWNLQITLGISLDAKHMSLRDGYSKGLAAQYLYGHIALNTDKCLWFARELKLAPQAIWSDWKWADLTADPLTLNLTRFWGKLEVGTRAAINTLISMNGTLRHDGKSDVIHILPGEAG